MASVVTGGVGFIGSHVCERLLADGKDVICVDNLLTSKESNIKHLVSNPKFTFIQEDVTKPLSDSTFGSLSIEEVFHLASPASPNSKSPRSYINHPIETLLVNSLGTYHMLELAKEKGARFLYASSSEVYGDPILSPQKEDYFGNVNPVGPRSVYDEGKRFGEAITMAYVRKFGLDARIIRIFNTYGDNMQVDDGRVVSNFITNAIKGIPLTVYGDGKQTRSFCYISDMVEGIILAMSVSGTKGKVINLGNPDEKTILELATIIKELTGTQSAVVFEPIPEDDPKRRKPDIALAKTMLGWEPHVALVEGLKKTIEYFKNAQ